MRTKNKKYIWNESDDFALFLFDEYQFFSSKPHQELDGTPAEVLFEDYKRWCEKHNAKNPYRPCEFRKMFERETPYSFKMYEQNGAFKYVAIYEPNNVEKDIRGAITKDPKRFYKAELEKLKSTVDMALSHIGKVHTKEEVVPLLERNEHIFSAVLNHFKQIREKLSGLKDVEVKTMGEIINNDKVLGTDNKWHSIKVLPIEEKQMYEFVTSSGNVTCSYDHKWMMFLKKPKKYSTEYIYKNLKKFKGVHIGVANGATLINVLLKDKEECRCISVDSDDHQFAILTDENKRLYTSNCAGRIVCGNVSTTASQMALDNSLGTTIKGEHVGSGIYSVNGEMTNIQFYYADQDWIKDWFKARGLDEKGYGVSEKEEVVHELDKEDEELHLSHEDITYEFQNTKKEITNQKDQHFETVK